MQIANVVLENYGAYFGRHDFLMGKRGLVLILGENADEPRMDSNGSAKSTLFEAVDWALFGVVPKGDHADSVIHDEASTCGVVVTVEDDVGSLATIERRRPASLRFVIDGVEQSASDTKETQTLINRWLGLDRDVFHAAVFFGQEDLRRFADARDAERMEILSRIIPELGEVDLLLERAKARKKSQEPILRAALQTITQLSAELAVLEKIDYETQIHDWELARKNRVAMLEKTIATKQAHLNEVAASAQLVPALQEELAALAAKPAVQIPDTVGVLPTVQQSLQSARDQRTLLAAELRQYEAQLSQIQQTGVGRCPTCGSSVTQEHLAFEQQRLSQEIGSRSRGLSDWDNKIQVFAHHEAGLLAELAELKAQAMAEVRARDHQFAQVQAKLAIAQKDQRLVATIARETQTLQAQVQGELSQYNPHKEAQQKAQDRILKLRIDWRVAKAQESEIVRAVEAYDFWINAFGPHGIKSLILDTKLQELTDAANQWVKLLTGGTMWVRFESQKMGRATKTLRNAPNIRVFRYHPDGRVTERNYRGWSGGEKQRISWAVDFGLSRLVARRAAKKWDLLVLDEVFKHVDSKGGEAVVEMLTQLQREKSSIFVIEHDSEFQAHFGTVIKVRKERGRSRILEVDSEEREKTECATQEGSAPTASVGTGKAKRPTRKKREARDESLPVDTGV